MTHELPSCVYVLAFKHYNYLYTCRMLLTAHFLYTEVSFKSRTGLTQTAVKALVEQLILQMQLLIKMF